MESRGIRKELQGIVVSDKMDKTVVVSIQRAFPHKLYGRIIRRSKKYKAHDEKNECKEGDTVLMAECRPLSKDKRWRVVEVLRKAQ